MSVQVVSLKGDVVTLSDNQYEYYQCCTKLLEQNPNAKLSRELINHFGVTRQRVHQILDNLVDYGLILPITKRAVKHLGKCYGSFTIGERTDSKINGNYQWKCLCDCGNVELHPSAYFTHRQKCGSVVACRDCIDVEKDHSAISGRHHIHPILMKRNGKDYHYLLVRVEIYGTRKEKLFSISRLGVMEAYAEAIKLRNEWLGR